MPRVSKGGLMLTKSSFKRKRIGSLTAFKSCLQRLLFGRHLEREWNISLCIQRERKHACVLDIFHPKKEKEIWRNLPASWCSVFHLQRRTVDKQSGNLAVNTVNHLPAACQGRRRGRNFWYLEAIYLLKKIQKHFIKKIKQKWIQHPMGEAAQSFAIILLQPGVFMVSASNKDWTWV